ncbi:MAG: thioesterase family protein [Gammaproteobacteria bacterium]|nr:thioesterase family protein [Gammaproteobacteria bacterium]
MIFTYPFTANLHDIDAAGVMFFAHYFRHAHDAYEAFMARIENGLPELIAQQTIIPLVHSEADFLLPVCHGDAVTIELSLERIGNSSFTLSYRFIDPQDRLSARVRTTHVMLGSGDRKPMALPETLSKTLQEYTA